MTLRRALYPTVLAVSLALALLLFYTAYRYDNKYTRPYIPAAQGEMSLEGYLWESLPPLFLIDGWAVYQYRWLSPRQLAGQTPDAYIFIGEYGGIELGDADAPPHGAATYRLTITTDGTPRQYALHMPQVYEAHQVWINGEPQRPAVAGTYTGTLYFRAETQIEIVVATSSDSHFYSGMVYPPVLGMPPAVNRLMLAQLAVRCGVLLAALLTGLVCLVLGTRRAYMRHARPLALVCLCFMGACAYPLLHALGLEGQAWYDMEHICYYAMLFGIVWIQGQMLRLPPPLRRTACLITGAVCPALPIVCRLNITKAGTLYGISRGLELYIWAAALYLVVTTALSLRQQSLYSKGLLIGFCIFALALMFDLLFPWFEPIMFGWHTETAGLIIVAIIAGLFFRDTVLIYKERQLLLGKRHSDRILLTAREKKVRTWKQYVDRTNVMMHEIRSRALVMRTKLRGGHLAAVDAMLSEMSGGGGHQEAYYTRHELLNAMLCWAFEKAAAHEIAVTYQIEGPLESLVMEDYDLAGIVMNLLENAIEANRALPGARRYIVFSVTLYGGILVARCKNPYSLKPRPPRPDAPRHGYGLGIVRTIAKTYHGFAEITRSNGVFSATVTLELEPAERARLKHV